MMLLLAEAAPQAAAQQGAGSFWLWAAFIVLVTVVMALDLGVFHRTAHRVSTREALVWVSVWVLLALLFNVGILLWYDPPVVPGRPLPAPGAEFFAGYILELSMSVDNIFVFVIIFTYFGVRPEHQHRVLFWGIIGAVVMRLLFIFVAIELVEHFRWLFYVFGAFLVYTGWKLLRHEPEVHPESNIVLRVTKRFLPVTNEYHGEKFFVRAEELRPAESVTFPGGDGGAGVTATASLNRKSKVLATPLFLVLLLIEATDVVFAVDSVPAILGVTHDRFIAYTSNIFAILGLRSMFFLLAGSLDKFHYLRYGLSLVLIFIGLKMLLQSVLGHINVYVSLLVIFVLLGGSVLLSFFRPPKKAVLPPEPEDTKPEPPGPAQ